MKNTILPVVCSFLVAIFASCGSPVETAKPSRTPLLLDAKEPANPEKVEEDSTVKTANLFVEGDKKKAAAGTFMEVQTGFEEFDTGSDPLSDRYNFSKTLKIGD